MFWFFLWDPTDHYPPWLRQILWPKYPDKHCYVGLFQSFRHCPPSETPLQAKTVWHQRIPAQVACELPHTAPDASGDWWPALRWGIHGLWSTPGQCAWSPVVPVPYQRSSQCCLITSTSLCRWLSSLQGDCLPYREIHSRQDHIILQQDPQQLETWAGQWGMKFNATKCYIMSLRSKSFHLYSLDNQILKQVPLIPYLGVQLSENQSWSEHVSTITKKVNSCLGLLRRNLRSCPEECRRTAYLAQVRSVLEYSAVVWDPHQQRDTDKLEDVQRRATHFIKQDYRSHQPGSIAKMLKDLNLPPLQDRWREKRLIFLYKTAAGLIPAIPAESFLTPVRNKRQIKITSRSDFISSNTIRRFARNNSCCFSLGSAKTDTYRNSFFIRTVSDCNNLTEEVVSAKLVEEFRSLTLTQH